MEKKAKYDLKILEDYINRGLLEKNDHPTLPLSIYNYSRECQFNKAWDDITLNMRGTILDKEGNIVALAFPKFFNYEEVVDKVPAKGDYVYVQDKMDGSLGILFWYEGEWHLATKGSFSSDQAKKGMEIIKSKYFLDAFQTHVTYLLEIIYPENRIVVDYGKKEKVVFIGATSEGEELHWTTALSIFKISGIKNSDIVNTKQYFSFGKDLYKDLKKLNTPNSEGFILRFQPGNFRIKIKFEEYVRLHRLLTNFSNVDIWELLKDGKDLNILLEKVPDEFDAWVRKTISTLKSEYLSIEEKAKKIMDKSIHAGAYTRKEIAEILMGVDPLYRSIIFNILDSKDYSHIIWKHIRPNYQKPFWNREEE